MGLTPGRGTKIPKALHQKKNVTNPKYLDTKKPSSYTHFLVSWPRRPQVIKAILTINHSTYNLSISSLQKSLRQTHPNFGSKLSSIMATVWINCFLVWLLSLTVWCHCVSHSVVSNFFVTLWTIHCQAPLSMEFSKQILEWVAISFSRESSQPRDWTQVSCTAGRFVTVWPPCLVFVFDGTLVPLLEWNWKSISRPSSAPPRS